MLQLDTSCRTDRRSRSLRMEAPSGLGPCLPRTPCRAQPCAGSLTTLTGALRHRPGIAPSIIHVDMRRTLHHAGRHGCQDGGSRPGQRNKLPQALASRVQERAYEARCGPRQPGATCKGGCL